MEPLFAQAPTLDGAYWLDLVARVAHILSAIVLLGGIMYLRKVVAPSLTSTDGDVGEQLYAGRRGAWAMWVGIATGLLLITGFYNFFMIIRANPELPGAYHPLFGIKFLLAIVVFFFAALLAGKSAGAGRARQHAKKWLTLCLAAGVLVVVLGSVLRSLHLPLPAADPATDTAEENL
jgi:uncharacterized membrane protein